MQPLIKVMNDYEMSDALYCTFRNNQLWKAYEVYGMLSKLGSGDLNCVRFRITGEVLRDTNRQVDL